MTGPGEEMAEAQIMANSAQRGTGAASTAAALNLLMDAPKPEARELEARELEARELEARELEALNQLLATVAQLGVKPGANASGSTYSLTLPPTDQASSASLPETSLSGMNLIAFSGGVDSTLVAAAVHRVFPTNTLAIIGVSASLPLDQLLLARELAAHIGIPLQELPTREGDLEAYIANDGTACLYCKTTLYQTMKDFAEALRARLASSAGEVVLFNGTNADDLTDPTRLGLQAAETYRVASPLKGLSKAEVRRLSAALGLPNAHHAASPCLRSRLAYGVPATRENLRRIEEAEQHVRTTLSLLPEHNLRVRHLLGDVAAIELDGAPLNALMSQEKQRLTDLTDAIQAIGFKSVSFRAFRTGSLSGFGLTPLLSPEPLTV